MVTGTKEQIGMKLKAVSLLMVCLIVFGGYSKPPRNPDNPKPDRTENLI